MHPIASKVSSLNYMLSKIQKQEPKYVHSYEKYTEDPST